MKQRFSSLDVKVIVHEISKAVVNLRVSNIYDLSSRIFLFKLAKPGTREQLLVDSGFRCHLTSFARTTAAAPSAFVSKLRKYLKSRRITSVSQIGTDRVIELVFSDGQYRVFLEFFAAGNIILTDKEYNILTLLRNVSEGNEEVDVKVGTRYPLAAKQNYAGIPPLTEERLTETLRNQVARAETLAEVNAKKAKKKGGDDLRKALAMGFPEYPTHLLDHSFKETSVDASVKSAQALKDVGLLSKLMKAVELCDRIFRSLGREASSKGYIIAKAKNDGANEETGGSERDATVPPREDLLYDDFHPFKPSQFEGKTGTFIIEIDGFNKTVDEFFSSIESQKLESRLTEREENAKKKMEIARLEHEKRIGALQQVQELHIRMAEAIEANAHRVEEAIAAVNGLIGQGMDWMDIAKLIENEQSRQNVVAQMIKLPLKLYENTVTLLLDEASFEQEEDDGGYETDELEESDDEEVTVKIKSSTEKRLAIDIDLALSPWANARQYYDQKKTAAQKEQKTLQASSKALKSTEQKISADLKKGLKQEKDVLRPARKQFWFEKFWYFISSDGYLVLGGKDAQQNELLYRRYLKKGDIYVHADLQGAASVVVKNAIDTPDAPIPPSTLSQAGSLSVCTSTAWDSKAVMAAWWVHADQVSKTAPTGEYLSAGGFVIKGSKNFLPPAQLLLGFAVAFHISESSKKNHQKHRFQHSDTTTPNTQAQGMSDETGRLSIEEEAESSDHELHGESDQEQAKDNEIEPKGGPQNSEDKEGSEQESANESDPEHDSEAEREDRTQATNPLQTEAILENAQPLGEDSESSDEQSEEPAQAIEDIEDIEDPTETTTFNTATSTPTHSQPTTTQTPSTPSTPASQKQTPAPRGKRTKAAKRAAAKYAHQDPAERALALQLLGSTKGASEKAQAATMSKAAREAKLAADKERRKAQHDRAAAAEKRRMERLEKGSAAADGQDGEDEAEEDKEAAEQERRKLANLDSLVGNPMPDDEILAALPIAAPWSALARYKYKVKLQPGALKKGKAPD
ncbi:hypothetical protein EPUS_07941 [Endocarpon pusillum Z07020]|uniref:Ribosome quality control complex subunit 2 n=1 Tax=Endocarpon pusillum (strain Z07020 / HMAS-L-300199) TaxID=1263415 RepID=U1I1A4_ENDPU|nr:uncharacterized protein EPUS_07941 [Endocarpon pusillum Z07020]ERF77035.1 hypothetical protein EPUS_07941 [Endocarpon pusillum Z07020]